MIPSSYAVGDFVCPGTLREGSLVEDRRVEHALAKTTLFSGFLSTMLLTFLSFSLFLMQQTPHAIEAKCNGSVYDVDVDVGRGMLLPGKLVVPE